MTKTARRRVRSGQDEHYRRASAESGVNGHALRSHRRGAGAGPKRRHSLGATGPSRPEQTSPGPGFGLGLN